MSAIETNTASPAGLPAATLIRILEVGYGPGAWYGSDLRAAVSEVTAAAAFTRPVSDRHNIAEVALHHAYWAGQITGRLTGSPAAPFPLDGEDWFDVSDESRLSWGAISGAEGVARAAEPGGFGDRERCSHFAAWRGRTPGPRARDHRARGVSRGPDSVNQEVDLTPFDMGRSRMVRPAGFEPATSSVGDWRSIQLSYGREVPQYTSRPFAAFGAAQSAVTAHCAGEVELVSMSG